ncbi:MAG: methionyl-tRNA formyltransferase [Candidatus Buchananbacteria bacterium]
MKTSPAKIIFLGTPEFAVPALLKLVEAGYLPELVITQPDRPAGRKQELIAPPVKVAALKLGLKVIQPNNKKELIEIIKSQPIDLAILVAFGMIIPKEILTWPRLGFLNLHPSLLPAYRGSSPIQTAILNGETKTGVSIIGLTDKVDAGPIYIQKESAIDDKDTAEDVFKKMAVIGAEQIVNILPGYLMGEIMPKIQDDKLATFTKIFDRQDGQINWQNSAQQILRQFKAFFPWPGIFTHYAGKRLKIANLSVSEGNSEGNSVPGTIFLTNSGQLAVGCGQGAVVLDKIQLEGKKEMSGRDFFAGQKDLVGKVLN